jgi:hypothetical protein
LVPLSFASIPDGKKDQLDDDDQEASVDQTEFEPPLKAQ